MQLKSAHRSCKTIATVRMLPNTAGSEPTRLAGLRKSFKNIPLACPSDHLRRAELEIDMLKSLLEIGPPTCLLLLQARTAGLVPGRFDCSE